MRYLRGRIALPARKKLPCSLVVVEGKAGVSGEAWHALHMSLVIPGVRAYPSPKLGYQYTLDECLGLL